MWESCKFRHAQVLERIQTWVFLTSLLFTKLFLSLSPTNSDLAIYRRDCFGRTYTCTLSILQTIDLLTAFEKTWTISIRKEKTEGLRKEADLKFAKNKTLFKQITQNRRSRVVGDEQKKYEKMINHKHKSRPRKAVLNVRHRCTIAVTVLGELFRHCGND